MRAVPIHRQRGFTLFEMVLSIVLMGILAVFGTSMVYNNMKTEISVTSGARTMDRARVAIERVARELREVKLTNSVFQFTSALSAGASSVAFVRTISGTDTTVTITKTGSTVTVQYSGVTGTPTLIDGVSSFSLDFYDSDGAATTSTANVKYVGITMVTSDSASGQTASQRMRVSLRNG
jgi:prepilin-type N-terminal cleavage/methylation domain-containing protein